MSAGLQTGTVPGPARSGGNTTDQPPPPGRARRGASRWQRARRDKALLLMVAPALVLLGVFHYAPLLGNAIAFQDYSPYVGFRSSPFIGLENFSRMFSDPLFWNATANTLTITGLQLALYFPVPIGLALLLNSVTLPRVRMFVQSVIYLPHFLSWVIVVALFQQMLGGAGLISSLLAGAGYPGFDLMADPESFKFLVTAQAIWKDAGWGTIIFLAALSSINSELYEAAAADGAGWRRRLWHVTLPALRPVIVLLLILRLGDALSVGFEQILLQRDLVGAQAAEVLDTFVYYTGVAGGDLGYATAAGLVKGLVGLVLIWSANKVAHLLGEQGVYTRA